MAGIDYSPEIRRIRGTVGDIVHKSVNGRPYVASLPTLDPKRRRTAKQKKQNASFRAGSLYATSVLRDPLQMRVYQRLARERQLSPNSLLIQNFSKPPVIETVDFTKYAGKAGGLIRILAFDAVEVASV